MKLSVTVPAGSGTVTLKWFCPPPETMVLSIPFSESLIFNNNLLKNNKKILTFANLCDILYLRREQGDQRS